MLTQAQVVGDGPFDLVFVPGFISHLDLQWADPRIARFLEAGYPLPSPCRSSFQL